VWLDRWSRRQVLVLANVVRAGLVLAVAALVLAGVEGPGFYTAGLLVFSVNRFVLSALSAGLPHTTDEASLVSANALSTTAGSTATVVGGGAALALLQVTGQDDGGYAAVALSSALPYLAAAAVVAGFTRDHLGPDHAARSARMSARDVAVGMVAGARHVATHPPASAALLAIGFHRFCHGLLLLMTLLLYRNTFDGGGRFFPGGLVGLAEVLAIGALGSLLAAAVTPRAVRLIGKPRWITVLLAGGGLAQLLLGLPFVPPSIVAAGFVLGFMGQGIKICVDSTLQESIADDFRGRVFSFYDTLVNVTFVVALVAAAWVLPSSGLSYGLLLAVCGIYLAAAAGYARLTRAR
jgi:hypothetical protein